MVGIFIMVIITIALVAGASASAFFLLSATQSSLTVQQNQIRVQSVSAAIHSGITAFNGRDVVPLKADGVSTTAFLARVPDIAPFNKTSSGRDIVYCPAIYAPTVNVNASVHNALKSGEEAFDIEVATKGGRSYLVGGFPAFNGTMGASPSSAAQALNNAGIYGFLLSADPRADIDMTCSAIQSAGSGIYTIPGGTALPVYGTINDQPASTYVVSSATASVQVLGNDKKPVGALADALEMIGKFNQAHATIEFNGDATISASEQATLSTMSLGRSIDLIGDDSGAKLTFAANGTTRLLLPVKGEVSFQNLQLTSDGGDFGIDATATARVDFINTDLNFIRSSGGAVNFEGASHLVSSLGSPVIADGGTIVFNVTSSASVPLINTTVGPVFAITGGRVLMQHNAYVTAPTGITFYTTGSSKTVDLLAGSLLYLNGVVQSATTTSYTRVSTTCADMSTSCVATCPTGKVITWGECNSSNNIALTGFFADTTGRSYTCKWTGSLIPPTAPTTAVVCGNPQN